MSLISLGEAHNKSNGLLFIISFLHAKIIKTIPSRILSIQSLLRYQTELHTPALIEIEIKMSIDKRVF